MSKYGYPFIKKALERLTATGAIMIPSLDPTAETDDDWYDNQLVWTNANSDKPSKEDILAMVETIKQERSDAGFEETYIEQ